MSRLRPRSGFTIIEALVSMIIVSTLLVAALSALGASANVMRTTGEQSRGQQLARDLMAEVMNHAYVDPTDDAEFGPSVAELTPGNRLLFDDVDDYDNWSASPPERIDGTPLAGLDGWSRTARVYRVKLHTLESTNSETGVKKIVVKVKRRGRLVAKLTALRADVGGD